MADSTHIGAVQVVNYAPDSDGISLLYATGPYKYIAVRIGRQENGDVTVTVEDGGAEEEATFTLGKSEYE